MQYNIQEIKTEIKEAKDYIISKCGIVPEIGVILGTGLGGLVKEIEIIAEIPYDTIPHFPVSTVESHKGNLIIGKLSGKIVIVMQGRFHYYEGYEMYRLTFPVRVMQSLGISKLMISNACGSVNPLFRKGDIMIIDDHINLLGDNPLIGINTNDFGPRFVDMSEPYSQKLIKLAEEVALENKITVKKGTFAAMSGPSLESRAEYRMLRVIGSDAIGMSTIPECIVARQIGVDVLGLSIITDECYPDSLKAVELEEIIEIANSTEPKMTLLFKKVIEKI
jgi:purine-nucleoside phosphorylase